MEEQRAQLFRCLQVELEAGSSKPNRKRCPLRVRLNEQSLEWLCDHRIFLQGYRKNGYRLKPGDFLGWWGQNPKVEPYVGMYRGDTIPDVGSFTYTFSAIPLGFTLGRYCSISWDVKFPGPRHPLELISTGGFMLLSDADMWTTYLGDTNSEFDSTPPNPQKPGASIGNDVWIGQDVSIMRDLTIGDGAVIAAGAVVTKSVESFAIVGGNPAKFIRWRFPEDVREELIALRWWRYGFSVLNRVDLTDVRNSMRDLRTQLADESEFAPETVDLMAMPHSGEV
jgi:virginiamycin A acetyltransferase